MKTSDFHQDIEGDASCTKIIMKADKGCVQLSSNDKFFEDIWLRRVKIVEEENA